MSLKSKKSRVTKIQTQKDRITKFGGKCTIIDNRTLAMLNLQNESRGVVL